MNALLRFRVKLQPGLEERAALWTPAKRLEMARRMETMARQLRMSVTVWNVDARPKTRRGLRSLPQRKLLLN